MTREHCLNFYATHKRSRAGTRPPLHAHVLPAATLVLRPRGVWLRQRLRGLESLKCRPSGPLQRAFADLCTKVEE